MTASDDRQREPGEEPADGPVERPHERRALDRLLEEEGPLPLPSVLNLLRSLGRELDRLHARGTIHAAVRPWQVDVRPGGTLGPGVAVTLGATPGSRAAAPRPAPTSAYAERLAAAPVPDPERDAAYRSPQLLVGEDARPADDLYALGVIAYELLTGALPFEAGAAASPTRRPVPPVERGCRLPPAVERVLLAQLSAAPAGRFATGLQFVRELERAAAPDRAPDRPASIADLLSRPSARPTFRRVPSGPGARQLALAELPDVTRAPLDPPRRRRVRRNDYPDLGLPGLWVVVIVVVLCSVYLLPGYFMARRFLGGLFPDLFGSG
ncbi:MAG: hypothetical protein M3O34_19235 [Chloroflexota bacterium]|nr:hypothetical protein [Chloroflexota bacterium]